MSQRDRITTLLGVLRDRMVQLREVHMQSEESNADRRAALVAKLAKNPKVRDPEALARWIGRRAGGLRGGRGEADYAENAGKSMARDATSMAKAMKANGASKRKTKKAIMAKLEADAAKNFVAPPGSDPADRPTSPQAAADAVAGAVPKGKKQPDPDKLARSKALQRAAAAAGAELSRGRDLDQMSDILDDMMGDGKKLSPRFDDHVAGVGGALASASGVAYSPAYKKYAQQGLYSFLKQLKQRLQYYTGMITDGIGEAVGIAMGAVPGWGGKH